MSASRAALPCQASSDRWHSGQGVTIASAPGLLGLDQRLDQFTSATSARASTIGNPQHLILLG